MCLHAERARKVVHVRARVSRAFVPVSQWLGLRQWNPSRFGSGEHSALDQRLTMLILFAMPLASNQPLLECLACRA